MINQTVITIIKPYLLRFIGLVLSFYILNINIKAQDRYWIFFTDKHNVKFNPYEYFDKKAIERRKKMSLSLYDSTDFPLRKSYVEKIKQLSENINCQFRWFNAVSVTATNSQIEQIKNLDFVKKVLVPIRSQMFPAGNYDSSLKIDEKQILKNQIELMEGELFINKGITGKGIRIAIFDAGFSLLYKIPALSHLIKNKRIVATWDFARKKAMVNSYNMHGTMVLSAIAGRTGNSNIGLATDAEFLLARTEIDRTSIIEEEYWLKAVEWADKNGADIINSSLAYTYERYNTFDMNGKTSLIARAADIAAKKGMLVINAMGNDGHHDWKVMATPADAKKVLSIGAVNRITKFHSGFSSFGPTADFRLKPNLSTAGSAVVTGRKRLKKVKGTSFSAALMSGFAACAWQVMPDLTNMQLFDKLQQSGSLYPYFDYAHGYGIPKASYFLSENAEKSQNPTFDFKVSKDTVWIKIKEDFMEKNHLKNRSYLYYHIENDKRYLSDYWLIDVYRKNAAYIVRKKYPKAKILRAHYKGFTNSIDLN